MSEVTKPLNDLLNNDAIWTWTAAQEEPFKRVKTLVTKSPALAFYDVNKPTIVSADASSYGLGGVLLQNHDGQLKPLSFCPEHSQILNIIRLKSRRSVQQPFGPARDSPDISMV